MIKAMWIHILVFIVLILRNVKYKSSEVTSPRRKKFNPSRLNFQHALSILFSQGEFWSVLYGGGGEGGI